MTESFRHNDMKAEKQLAEFMDRCFYSIIWRIILISLINEKWKDARYVWNVY